MRETKSHFFGTQCVRFLSSEDPIKANQNDETVFILVTLPGEATASVSVLSKAGIICQVLPNACSHTSDSEPFWGFVDC